MEDYVKTYKGTAYDGRKYYVSYVNIEELPSDLQEKFRKYQTGAACPIIPNVKESAYSWDWLRFINGNV